MNTDLNANTVELLRNWGMFDHAVGDGKAPKALVDLANDYRSLVIDTYDLAATMTPQEWRKNWESWYYAKEILARQLAEFSHKYPYSQHRLTTTANLVELCHRMGSLFWTMGHDYTTDIFCKANPRRRILLTTD